MKNNLKKIVSVLLAVCALFTICALGGCTPAPSEEEKTEALEAFKALYPKSVEINEYIFGVGLPTEKNESGKDTSPLYINVSEQAKYKTESDFKTVILEVYSQSYYADAIEPLLFKGYEEDSDISPRYRETQGVLQLDISAEQPFDVSGRFDVSTAEVVKLTAAFCQIRCSYKRGDFSGEFELVMEKTADGWRFSALTI